jgi:N-acetylglucosaminyldiphosphoundecaprenol N-acetyl-beta-D-mannosaminyltransferase
MWPLRSDPPRMPARDIPVGEAGEPTRSDARVPARRILGMRVDATSYTHAAEQTVRWARQAESRYVCIATVNNVIEAYEDPSYAAVMNGADLVTPDGMPLVWGLRMLGVPKATRVYGPDLTPVVCKLAAAQGIPVGFYGGTDEVLDALTANLARQIPQLEIAYRHSPPFREATPDEQRQTVEDINRSGARVLFVGLGAPKQERWMAAQKGQVTAVMLGVGAAFDFLAGKKRQAPRLVQQLGLEWLYRLVHEPRRLWRRYLYRNPRFVALFATQLVRERRHHRRRASPSTTSPGRTKEIP